MVYRLTANGTDILDVSNNITWNSDKDTLSCNLSFESLYSIPMGGVVSLYINGLEVFRGVVLTCQEHKFTFSYTCTDYAHYLKNEVITQFNNVEVTQAISSLLLQYEIEHVILNIPTKIDKIYTGETIEKIIDDMLEQSSNDQGQNYYKEIIGAKLYINTDENKAIYPKFIIEDSSDIDWSISELKNKIIVMSDTEDVTKIEAVAYDPYSRGRYGILQKVEKVDDKDISQSQNIANNLLTQLNRVDHTASVNILLLDGAENVRANRYLYLENEKLKGWYKINAVNHSINNGIHKATINVRW